MQLYFRFLKEFVFCPPNYFTLFVTCSIAGITSLLSFITPAISKAIIDSITINPDVSFLNFISIIAGGILFLSTALGFIQNKIINNITQKIALYMRYRYFKNVQQLSWDFYDRFRGGELQYRMFNDVSILAETASFLPIHLVINLLFLITANMVMFFLNWKVAIFVNVILVINTGLYITFQKRIEQYSWVLQKRAEEVYGLTQEQLNRMKLAQLNSATTSERRMVFNILRKLSKDVVKKNVFMSNSSATIGMVSGLWSTGILWLGGYTVIQQNLTLGDLVAFLSLTGLMTPVTTGIVSTIIQYPSIRVSISRFFEIIDEKPSVVNSPTAKGYTVTGGKVDFKNVSFLYPGSQQPILENFNMSISPGSLTVITGSSGSGKSTLLKLIGRFYDCLEGSIEIDGMDVRDINLKSIRQQIGYVGSYTTIISGTVFDNITYGTSGKSLEDVMEAAALAYIHERIEALPDGYFTVLGVKGVELSDGEKQRINLARCFLMKPPIWLLDEATANLDSETEDKIMQNLCKEKQKKTIVMVSHRQNPINYADFKINIEQKLGGYSLLC